MQTLTDTRGVRSPKNGTGDDKSRGKEGAKIISLCGRVFNLELTLDR